MNFRLRILLGNFTSLPVGFILIRNATPQSDLI